MTFVVPPGKLGVSFGSFSDGTVRVVQVRESSPLRGKLLLHDKLTQIDDEDVNDMGVAEICGLLGSRAECERKISIRRVVQVSATGMVRPVAIEPPTDGNSTTGGTREVLLF